MNQARGRSRLPAFSIIYGFENTGSVHLGTVEKVLQRRSRSAVVPSYSVYAPRANCPAALLDSLFEQHQFHLP
jgi:hypothetical protein